MVYPLNADTIAGIGTIALGLFGAWALVIIYGLVKHNERLGDRIERAQNEANRWRDIAAGHVRPAQPVPAAADAVTGELLLPQPIRGHRRA
jgi:hypothetical protein